MEQVAVALIGAAATVTVALLARQSVRSRNVEKRVEEINKAVNSKPADQPVLYDLVQTMDIKMEAEFGKVHQRIDMLHRRVDGIADKPRRGW